MQGQLFDPDNAPLAFPKEDPQLEQLKAQMRATQLERIKAHNLAKHGAK